MPYTLRVHFLAFAAWHRSVGPSLPQSPPFSLIELPIGHDGDPPQALAASARIRSPPCLKIQKIFGEHIDFAAAVAATPETQQLQITLQYNRGPPSAAADGPDLANIPGVSLQRARTDDPRTSSRRPPPASAKRSAAACIVVPPRPSRLSWLPLLGFPEQKSAESPLTPLTVGH
ncbi:hypothetical protein OF83DRAFT_1170431 [Amylostereum chailletii]|nr:hypothetical protein OF83DRAFT_1170431 [Amylostereum chailletii]